MFSSSEDDFSGGAKFELGNESPIAAERFRKISETKTMNIGVCPGAPPFAYMTAGGVFAGMEIDIMKAVAKELGYEAVFSYCPRSDMAYFLRSGKFDVVCGGFDVPSLEKQYLSSAASYFNSVPLLLYRQTGAPVKVASDFDASAHTLVTLEGSREEEAAARLFPKCAKQTVGSYDKAVGLVRAGEGTCAFLVSNMVLAEKWGGAVPPDVSISKPFSAESRPVAFAVRMLDPRLKKQLDNAFAAVRKSGLIGQMFGVRLADGNIGEVTVKPSAPAAPAKKISSDVIIPPVPSK